jgi:hypothetical protein
MSVTCPGGLILRNVPADLLVPICALLDTTSQAALFATLDKRIQQLMLYPHTITSLEIQKEHDWKVLYLAKHLKKLDTLIIGNFSTPSVPSRLVPALTQLEVTTLDISSSFNTEDVGQHLLLFNTVVDLTALFPHAIHLKTRQLGQTNGPLSGAAVKAFMGKLSQRLETLEIEFNLHTASNFWNFMPTTLRHLTLLAGSKSASFPDRRIINVIRYNLPNLETLKASLCVLMSYTKVSPKDFLKEGANTEALLPPKLTSLAVVGGDHILLPDKFPAGLLHFSYGSSGRYEVEFELPRWRAPRTNEGTWKNVWKGLPHSLQTLKLPILLAKGEKALPFPSGLVILECHARWMPRSKLEKLPSDCPNLESLTILEGVLQLKDRGFGDVKSLRRLSLVQTLSDEILDFCLMPPNMTQLKAMFSSYDAFNRWKTRFPSAQISVSGSLPWSAPLCHPQETVLNGFTISEFISSTTYNSLLDSSISLVTPSIAEMEHIGPTSFPSSLTRVSLSQGFTSSKTPSRQLKMPFSALHISDSAVLISMLPDSVTEIDLGHARISENDLPKLPSSLRILRHVHCPYSVHFSSVTRWPPYLEVLEVPKWQFRRPTFSFPSTLKVLTMKISKGIYDHQLLSMIKYCHKPVVNLVGGAVRVSGKILNPTVFFSGHADLEMLRSYSQAQLESQCSTLKAEFECQPWRLKMAVSNQLPPSVNFCCSPSNGRAAKSYRKTKLEELPLGPQVTKLEVNCRWDRILSNLWKRNHLTELILHSDCADRFETSCVPPTVTELTLQIDGKPPGYVSQHAISFHLLPKSLTRLIAPQHTLFQRNGPIDTNSLSSRQNNSLRLIECSFEGGWLDMELAKLAVNLPKLETLIAHGEPFTITMALVSIYRPTINWDIIFEDTLNAIKIPHLDCRWRIVPETFAKRFLSLHKMKHVSLLSSSSSAAQILHAPHWRFSDAMLKQQLETIDLEVGPTIPYDTFYNSFPSHEYPNLTLLSIRNPIIIPQDFGANLPRQLKCLNLPLAEGDAVVLRSLPDTLELLLLDHVIINEESALAIPQCLKKLNMTAPWSSWVMTLLRRRMPALIISTLS